MKKNTITILLTCGLLFLTACGSGAQRPNPDDSAPEPQIAETDGSMQASVTAPEHGLLIHIERSEKDANDPAEGKSRILNYAWDSVRLESDRNPEAAAAVMEDLAARQDAWYTGSGEDGIGWQSMLDAAEDDFTLNHELGRESTELIATRFVTVLPTGEAVCAFLIRTDTLLGGVPRETVFQALCYDAETGELLKEERSEDATALEASVSAAWPPKEAADDVRVSIHPLEKLEENSVEIVDRVVIGDGGEASVLFFDGEALDAEICAVSFTDHFEIDRQLFFCDRLRDCALQTALLFPGDLPNTMLRYRDRSGEHEYLITLSGEDGRIMLAENIFSEN